MGEKYLISVDQSTQGTKALLFDGRGALLARRDLPHKQIINEQGWVSHDPIELYSNTIRVIRQVIDEEKIDRSAICGIGISNQRETSVIWNKTTGEPLDNAIVWQCSRATEICAAVERAGHGEEIRSRTGIPISPYFPASKFAWLLQNAPGATALQKDGSVCFGTIDTWLVYKMTEGNVYRTDYSNASRTQLFNIRTLSWDEDVCAWFGLSAKDMAEVCDSNCQFGETTLEGFFDKPIPIHSVLGDSHAALFGHGCLSAGMTKTTYGTGSSIMMNVGDTPVFSTHGVVSSLAWGIDGKATYVLEGNINYTGAIISWLKDNVKLIESAKETQSLAESSNPADTTYLVPAFSGLGAPYWDSLAKASISGMTRVTGKAEIVRAGLDAIAYQIMDVVEAMKQDAGLSLGELHVDGGPTRNGYLMQLQSDLIRISVQVPEAEEFSGIGAAYMAGMALGLYDKSVFNMIKSSAYRPSMDEKVRDEKVSGWKAAVQSVLGTKPV